jgi:probable rRNA maturation factor
MAERTVEVNVMPGCRGRISVPELRRVVRRVLEAEAVAPEVEVEVVLSDLPTIRELNRLYRGKDEPTDVLSFAQHEGEPFIGSPDETASLGEVVICVPYAEAQVEAAGASDRTVKGEISHLLVHGLLHLLGHDHELGEDESRRMQQREEDLLSVLGYDGQYSHGH